MIRIAVLVSGSGTNLQSLIDNCRTGFIPGEIVLVISNKPDVYAIERAEKERINTKVIEKKNFKNEEEFYREILKTLNDQKVDLVCLAGFLLKIGEEIVRAYKNRIMNIHPALLPSFGGKGMYGIRVHEAVIKSGEAFTGCTVHMVDEEYDHGSIVMQKKIPVGKDDTPHTLAERVLNEEHILYSLAVRNFALKYKKE